VSCREQAQPGFAPRNPGPSFHTEQLRLHAGYTTLSLFPSGRGLRKSQAKRAFHNAGASGGLHNVPAYYAVYSLADRGVDDVASEPQ